MENLQLYEEGKWNNHVKQRVKKNPGVGCLHSPATSALHLWPWVAAVVSKHSTRFWDLSAQMYLKPISLSLGLNTCKWFSSIYPTRLGFLSVNSLGNMLIYKLEVKQEWEIVGSLPLGAWVVTMPSRRKWCSPDFSCIGTITKRLFLNLVTVSDLRPLKQSLIWGKQMSHLEKYIKWSICGRPELRKESWKENWQNTSVSITWNRSILGSWYFRWMTHPSRHPSALGHQHRPQCSSSYHTSLIPHSSNFALHLSILRWCSILCSQ